MADKKELADLLSGLSEEELFNLANIISKATTKKPRNKKRAAKKTAKKKVVKKKEQSDFMHSLRLNPQEKAELKSAEKFDKEKGLDKPKEDGIMSKGPLFQKISIKCMECSKEFQVSPALIPPETNRFRCNSCSCRGRPQR